MAAKNVKTYWAGWDADGHFGTLNIQTDDNMTTIVTLTNASEFAVMVDLLRNEKPLQWDHATKKLTTFNESPGEGEA
jgi:hypothetical protein